MNEIQTLIKLKYPKPEDDLEAFLWSLPNEIFELFTDMHYNHSKLTFTKDKLVTLAMSELYFHLSHIDIIYEWLREYHERN